MKESPGRYINPFLSDEENDKLNFTTNLDDEKFEKSLEPSISESFQKPKEVYIDKNVTECQLPEMITCYEESGFNVVKDICVDEGLSHGEIIKCDKEHHELLCNPITVNGDKHDDMSKDDLDSQLISTPLNQDYYKNTSLFSVTEDDNVPSNSGSDNIKVFVESNIDPDNSMQNGEEKLDSSSDSLNNSIRVLEPTDNGVNDVDQQLSEAQQIDIPNEIKMEENNTTSDSENVEPATTSGPHEPPLSIQSIPNHHDMASSNITVAARGGGESSFSMAGPISGLITYSGPITASGSISHRSDGSNSSVRSFTFPILQNEWNSSPVRMAKMDTKQSRKHRGWRQAVVCCCRF
ncbi:hypothetical protein L1987_62836 [Smallanthus sonchifolius]|uniref:Uncharacterized protein n=1 Tax=Smallanthus sonchifolius TaxID=185202 RepID=A0ACB9CBL3_9ASTR|nr:hypothetical protein L1987_62836 [Smallanthus sonchifolius]